MTEEEYDHPLTEMYKSRRKARLPKWTGYHGDIVKGSVHWDATTRAWSIVFPYLIGYSTTQRARELYYDWRVAVLVYMEHYRAVREKKQLEDFRSVRAVL